MENNNNYVIGDKEYTREELLTFGKQHYPKFYWIKRGVGIGLMFIGILDAIFFFIFGYQFAKVMEKPEYIWFYYPEAIIFAIMGIVGIILFAVSYKPLPDEAYVKHAVDYYTKLDIVTKRRDARLAQRKESQEINQMIKYKKLLDAGVISQEEYEEKKKEILGQ